MKNANLNERSNTARKRIKKNTLIISILVFIFISILAFVMSVKQVSTAFQNKFNRMMLSMNRQGVYTETFDNISNYACYMMKGYDDEPNYPVAVGLYSLKGDLIHTSGSTIDIETKEIIRTVNIDSYMTDEILNDIKKYLHHNNWNELRISNFKYTLDSLDMLLLFEMLNINIHL